MTSLIASAQARVGLLGNPSDIYGGQGLGFSLSELGVTVTLTSADANNLPNELFEAAWKLMAGELTRANVDSGARPFALSFSSNVPFQGGLSGSSALVIAAIRAWSRWFGMPIEPLRVAELAFRVENEVLGIRAGPLDRLVQAHDGLLAMNFAEPFADNAVQRLDPDLLPPLVLAWHSQPGKSSGDVHAPIFARWQANDPDVSAVVEQLIENAKIGKNALLQGDRESFLRCMNRNFDLRAQVFPIADADRALIDLGRTLGAGSKLPGSGGAVLFGCRDEAHRAEIELACQQAGHETLRPTVHCALPRLRAVFLAAGFATRLYPLTEKQAKPLLQVGGKPMLTRIVDQVVRTGSIMDAVVVANGRFHDHFVEWEQGDRAPLPIHLVNDGAMSNDTRLGAIRDLALGLDQSVSASKPDGYLVLACDNLFSFDLSKIVDRFRASGCGQLIVRQVPSPVPPGRYSEVMLDGEKVRRFREKPQNPESDLSAIAVYVLPPQLPELVQEYLQAGENPDAPGHFLAWLSARMPLEATRLTGDWLDIGSVEDLEKAQTTFG
jgi:glucose-1-phosphate thymidylyltransferase